jgi:hypothetical protein
MKRYCEIQSKQLPKCDREWGDKNSTFPTTCHWDPKESFCHNLVPERCTKVEQCRVDYIVINNYNYCPFCGHKLEEE